MKSKSFYTRAGDHGLTGSLVEGRISKADLKIETLGSVDEVNSALGVARSLCHNEGVCTLVLQIQRELYSLMSEIAASPDHAERFQKITTERVTWLEEQVDEITQKVNVPKEFIVPGDYPSSAAFDLARTTVRRAERRAVQLMDEGGLKNAEILRYLNRLSSLCFILEIYEIQQEGAKGPTYSKSAQG